MGKSKIMEDDKKMMPPKGDTKGDGGASADHADADQDKQLFAQMVKQYLGKDDADEAEMEMSKHAYQAHREGGMEHDEAYEAAGKHLAMAAAIGKKMHQAMEGKEKHEGESEESHESEKEHEEGDPDCKDKGDDKDKEPKEKKESAAKIAKLSGENAKLRESLKAFELRDHLESKLKESKVSNQVTKLFRETLGKPKSVSHIDDTWNMFIKAFKAGAEEVSSDSESFFVEKSTYRTESTEKKDSMEDCLR